MTRFKNKKLKKLISIFVKHPKYIIPVAAALFFVLFCGFECIRARIYLNAVSNYKNSVEVLVLQDSVERLNESVKLSRPAYFCDIQFNDLLPEFNQAYMETSSENNRPEVLIARLNDQVNSIKPAPAYSSFATFLPQPKNARAESQRISSAIVELEKLTKIDVRSTYCLGLRDALSRVYFLEDIQRPEGVNALLAGQINNFQVNARQAQELAQSLPYPDIFEKEHIAINKQLLEVASNLQGNDNDLVSFSRTIEQDVKGIQSILESIRALSGDLIEIPEQITISSDALKHQ